MIIIITIIIIIAIITLKIATLYEQFDGWGNNINFIFIRDQNLPPL